MMPPMVGQPLNGRLWAVVPAGGAGTRLWPLSRAGSPKFLHDLTGSGRSLLQATHDRLSPLVGDRILVVTGVAHQDAVRRQLDELPADQVIAEPSPRDSMAAIGLAAAIVERRDPDALIGSFAADHVIADADAFRACVSEAADVAETGQLVTIGIAPVRPSTGFGYIHLGAPLSGFPTARAVEEFVEKPDAVRAAQYLDSGEYRWNAGMFVARATVLLDLLAAEHPELASGLRTIAAEPERLEEIWPGLTRIAIDHAVAEPAAAAGRVAVVPAGFAWEDIGDFAALAELVPGNGVKVLGDADRVVALGSSGLVVPDGGRTVAVLGLEDVVVVDTGDAVLVTTSAHAQDVKSIVEALKASGRGDLT
jgi:mannose-1-phosphate guanylyltransferase